METQAWRRWVLSKFQNISFVLRQNCNDHLGFWRLSFWHNIQHNSITLTHINNVSFNQATKIQKCQILVSLLCTETYHSALFYVNRFIQSIGKFLQSMYFQIQSQRLMTALCGTNRYRIVSCSYSNKGIYGKTAILATVCCISLWTQRTPEVTHLCPC